MLTLLDSFPAPIVAIPERYRMSLSAQEIAFSRIEADGKAVYAANIASNVAQKKLQTKRTEAAQNLTKRR